MQVNEKTVTDESLPPRLKELQQKIQDEDYITYAVDRIAIVMSKRIVDLHEAQLRNPSV